MDYLPLLDILNRYPDFPLVSISEAQRKLAPWLNWRRTVHHGLPKDMFKFMEKASNYVLFLERICPEKRPDRAIEIARLAGIPLIIATKVDPLDRDYFNDVIRPLLSDPNVQYVGEIRGKEKQALIGKACALIHPVIAFPEPFGIVMIESMACGTPVISFRKGSIPAVLDEGVIGFVAEDVRSAVEALVKVKSLDRRRCREVFEKRFTAKRMADDYLTVYNELVSASGLPALPAEDRLFDYLGSVADPVLQRMR